MRRNVVIAVARITAKRRLQDVTLKAPRHTSHERWRQPGSV
jgi:hypothetical protein